MRTQGTYYIRGTEGRKDGRTEGRNAENYVPPLFFEKAGDKKNIIKPPLLPAFISSVIQFDKFFRPVALYENYLICMFMNINENFSNERKKILEKIKGCTYKINNVSPTMCCSVSNLVQIQCLDIVPLL